ncbi:hypothetical protein [Mesorhizobium sp. YM1C-6-2]|uniref:hypothetical protein n=1 Tax=Mesorhizobium sp. YM1C-6-2 TaxID=1827501 RepID=UPI000EF1F690|nr:hypothetical protein [Mesorhizobium sp. YM1C-6-2]RLP22270.1 hypothetical protein D8676_25370 [Mesorhizobium sp. YM1C-6-2]
MATVNVTSADLTLAAHIVPAVKTALDYLLHPADLVMDEIEFTDPNYVILREPWPFRPLLPVTETIETLTDILSARTGEQRIALRKAPRQFFSYAVRTTPARFSRAKDYARRRAGTPVGVPVWIEGISLAGDVGAADTTIAIDTTRGDWRVDGGVLIWESPERYARCRISAIADDMLTLLGPVGGDFIRPTILPLRSALPYEGFQVLRDTTYQDISAKFQVIDNIWLDEDAGYDQYEDLDVISETPKLVSDIAESIVRAAEYVDNGFGPIVVETVRDYVDFGQTLSFHEWRGAALWRRRCWIHSLNGKQKPFWLPSFNADLSLQATIGAAATTITVASISPDVDSYAGQHVMILLTNGTKFYREILGAAPAGFNDVLTISSALGQSVAAADVALFCFMSKVRLSADSVEIRHEFDDASIVSIPVIETPA